MPGVTAGLWFQFAVLWLDLMFDVQAARSNTGELSRDALGSISSYYRRITTTARPMNRLVTVVMATTLAALIAEILDAPGPRLGGMDLLVPHRRGHRARRGPDVSQRRPDRP